MVCSGLTCVSFLRCGENAEYEGANAFCGDAVTVLYISNENTRNDQQIGRDYESDEQTDERSKHSEDNDRDGGGDGEDGID